LRKKQRGKVRALLSKLSGLSMPQITRLIRAITPMASLPCSTVHGSDFRSNIRCGIWSCWSKWIGLTSSSVGRRPGASWSGSGRFSASASMPIWRRSRRHIFTICGTAWDTGSGPQSLPKPSRRGLRSANDARPNPQGVPGYVRIDTVHQGDWDMRLEKRFSDGLLLFFAARRAAQNVSFLALRNGYLLHFHFRPHSRPVIL